MKQDSIDLGENIVESDVKFTKLSFHKKKLSRLEGKESPVLKSVRV